MMMTPMTMHDVVIRKRQGERSCGFQTCRSADNPVPQKTSEIFAGKTTEIPSFQLRKMTWCRDSLDSSAAIRHPRLKIFVRSRDNETSEFINNYTANNVLILNFK